ncbi:MAG: hypothetical protein ABI647_19310 [Gemmatimonadota bacterium]
MAVANGMPYHEHATLGGAIRSHLNVLRKMGTGVTADQGRLTRTA